MPLPWATPSFSGCRGAVLGHVVEGTLLLGFHFGACDGEAWGLRLRAILRTASAPTTRFLFKAKKAAMMTQPPATPTLPRLPHEVVPADDRDDPDIILNTTTVSAGDLQLPDFTL